MYHEVENLPGDPETLEAKAARMENFAEALEKADEFLRNEVNGEFDSSAAKSIDALKEQAESIGDQYRSASSQYFLCAKGLARYAMTLDWVQEDMKPIVEEYNELDDLGTLRGPGATVDKDELPDGMNVGDVADRKKELQREYNTLYEEWQTAFREATALIGAGIQISEPELDEPSTLEQVLDWLAVGGTVLAIAAFWWNPLGWGAAAAGGAALGIQGYRYSQGDASLGEVAEAGVGVFPFGRFYKLKALPDGGHQLVPGPGLTAAKSGGMSDEALNSFQQLSPQTQLLLTGAAYGDVKNTFDGLTGAVDSSGDLIYGGTDTDRYVKVSGVGEDGPSQPANPSRPANPSQPSQPSQPAQPSEPIDRTKWPAR